MPGVVHYLLSLRAAQSSESPKGSIENHIEEADRRGSQVFCARLPLASGQLPFEPKMAANHRFAFGDEAS
jgi:hypothetical protein